MYKGQSGKAGDQDILRVAEQGRGAADVGSHGCGQQVGQRGGSCLAADGQYDRRKQKTDDVIDTNSR